MSEEINTQAKVSGLPVYLALLVLPLCCYWREEQGQRGCEECNLVRILGMFSRKDVYHVSQRSQEHTTREMVVRANQVYMMNM